jgi:hypothetical protein
LGRTARAGNPGDLWGSDYDGWGNRDGSESKPRFLDNAVSPANLKEAIGLDYTDFDASPTREEAAMTCNRIIAAGLLAGLLAFAAEAKAGWTGVVQYSYYTPVATVAPSYYVPATSYYVAPTSYYVAPATSYYVAPTTSYYVAPTSYYVAPTSYYVPAATSYYVPATSYYVNAVPASTSYYIPAVRPAASYYVAPSAVSYYYLW